MASNEPTVSQKSGDAEKGPSKPNPPGVITVDTVTKDGPSGDAEKGFVQARTPKHANKTKDEDGAGEQKNTPDRGEHKNDHYGQRSYGGNFPPPRPYEGRPLGGNGAFQPHEPRRQPPPPKHADQAFYNRSPIQVSPGGGANGDYRRRYYGGNHGRNGPHRMGGGYPAHPPPHHPHGGYYEQRGYGEYGQGRPPPGYEAHGSSGYRGQYPPPQGSYPQQSYGSYPPEARGKTPGWGSHPPTYPPSHSGQYPSGSMPPEHYQRPPSSNPADHPSGNSNFTRAVSSSFESRTSKEKAHGLEPQKLRKPSSSPSQSENAMDASVGSADDSWKLLKQVHSVDDSAIREELQKQLQDANEGNHIRVGRQPASNSSSLTNSPTDGPERHHAAKEAEAVVAAAAAANQPSSLDSLASVSSAQQPLDTPSKTQKSANSTKPPSSPGSESASLDLMKCSSGSSGLLHLPPHQRNIEGLLFDGKRGRDEERGDVNTNATTAGDEERRGPSDYEEGKGGRVEHPPNKKVRVKGSIKDDSKNADVKRKASPLSITCSPSAKKDVTSRSKSNRSVKADYHASPQPLDGYFDKPPTYTYSMDSAPSIPRDGGHRKQPSYPSLPPRPGSSSSSTITPGQMHIDGREGPNTAVPSIASWDIHAQDSFGAGSIGGGPSLSFQDYPMLSESNLGPPGADTGSNGNPFSAHPVIHGRSPNSHHHPHHSSHPPIESRNQSYDYHDDNRFPRSDSMMDVSYGARPSHHYADYKHGHTGQFPPHAPSWGTAGSGGSHPSYQGPPPSHYNQYGGRVGSDYPPHTGGVMRNYSQDSRTSPPPGPPGGHRMHPPGHRPPPGAFQPPPEFAAPQNHLNRRPPPAVYIMSSTQGSGHPAQKRGTGVFSWTKDDDMRLTEIMKKYKNPRDWEPIAKEHGRGKTAKECCERWIRYLKPGVRKGQWTDQEDAIVIDAVTSSSEQPFTRWSDLAQRLPGRVGKQIRDRWVNHLNPAINHLPFSRDDDLLLWEGHKKLGKRWVEISTKFFNSTRSENHIKNRWYSASFKKFIANEFGPEAYSGTKKGKDESVSKSKKKAKVEDDPAMQAV